MCLFFDCIQLKDGYFKRLDYHQERANKALAEIFPEIKPFSLKRYLQQLEIPNQGLYKCKITYNSSIQHIEFIPYQVKTIKTLKLVNTDIESHPFKLVDRSSFTKFTEQRDICDDVLLVRNGLLTDTSICNIALFDGSNWATPRTPLIYGTNRAYLLEKGFMVEKDIFANHLANYQKITLFNALIDFQEIIIDVDSIY